jgi:hypothetical protein
MLWQEQHQPVVQRHSISSERQLPHSKWLQRMSTSSYLSCCNELLHGRLSSFALLLLLLLLLLDSCNFIKWQRNNLK